jgi:hypothetical protein
MDASIMDGRQFILWMTVERLELQGSQEYFCSEVRAQQML